MLWSALLTIRVFLHFNESVVMIKVDKALERVHTHFGHTTCQPHLAHKEDHTYDNKFTLTEFTINTCNAAIINAFWHLGLTTDKFQTISKWVHNDQQSVMLCFEAQDTCTFVKESIIEHHGDTEYEVEKTTMAIPDKISIKKTIQITSLHWQNDTKPKQWQSWSKNHLTNMTMTIMIEWAIKTPDEPPEGSWWTKVPLGCAIPMGICSCPMVKG